MILLGKEKLENDAGDDKIRLVEIVLTKQQKVLETHLEFWKSAEVQDMIFSAFCLKLTRKKLVSLPLFLQKSIIY
jgi:hypothetical protein